MRSSRRRLQFKNFLPSSGGFRNILLAGLLIFLAWQSAFIIGPDEEGVVKRFGIPVRTSGAWPSSARSRSSSRCYSQKWRNSIASKSAFGRIARAGSR